MGGSMATSQKYDLYSSDFRAATYETYAQMRADDPDCARSPPRRREARRFRRQPLLPRCLAPQPGLAARRLGL